MQTYFTDEYYSAYIGYLAESVEQTNNEVWAYCLMPNHVRLVLVPSNEDGWRAAMADAHRRCTHRVNFKEGWRGHLWQERFHSFAMDEMLLYRAVRYVKRNPLGAGICQHAISRRRSSARAHVSGKADTLCRVEPMLNRVENWNQYLSSEVTPEECEEMRRHTRTGRPLGNDQFVYFVEELTGRDLKPGKPGPKLAD